MSNYSFKNAKKIIVTPRSSPWNMNEKSGQNEKPQRNLSRNIFCHFAAPVPSAEIW